MWGMRQTHRWAGEDSVGQGSRCLRQQERGGLSSGLQLGMCPPHLPCTTPQGYCRARTNLFPTFTSSVLPTTAKGRCAWKGTQVCMSTSLAEGKEQIPLIAPGSRKVFSGLNKDPGATCSLSNSPGEMVYTFQMV
jgi:hypothetical protein